MKNWQLAGWILLPFLMLPLYGRRIRRTQRTFAVIWSLVILAAAYSLYDSYRSSPHGSGSEAASGGVRAKVIRVVDGDTLEVELNGKKETVRLVLVDTPETKHPTKPVEPFGPEASQFTKKALEGQTVELVKDVSDRDQYGRLLRYVYLDGKLFNEQLIEQGLARVAVFPPDVRFVDSFRKLQKKAQAAKMGIWSIEDYVTDRGYNDSKAQNQSSGSAGAAGSSSQAVTKPAKASHDTVYYRNCTEVKAAGAAPLQKNSPGYRSALDPDQDGVACER